MSKTVERVRFNLRKGNMPAFFEEMANFMSDLDRRMLVFDERLAEIERLASIAFGNSKKAWQIVEKLEGAK